MKKIINFIGSSLKEIIEKVAWPPYKTLQNNSILVLVVSVIFAIVVGLIDFSLKSLISWFYSIF